MTRLLSVNSIFVLACSLLNGGPSPEAAAGQTIDIGARLQPLIDHHLIDQLTGQARLRMHRPQPREVVLVTDQPWEGNTCAYYTIFQDGDRYRMYYRGSHFDTERQKSTHREVTCYAESTDGIHWKKPALGLVSFDGSRKNNIVWDGVGSHCFTPMMDANPDCKPAAKYKAISRGRPLRPKGLYAFQSPDGLHWELISSEPVITDGDFDSQNLAFWDPVRKVYVAYYRKSRDGVRDIMTCTSHDFLHWTEPVFLEYPGAPKEHLYTNAIRPYPRAPHILLGFPTRFQPATQQVEPILMTSRDGRSFHRWSEPLIPISAPKDRDGNRSNYMARGLIRLPGDQTHYTVYATEAYYTGPDSRLRRFTFRVDGFVSVRAPAEGGQLLTKPLRFAGGRLVINSATSATGSVRIELQDLDGRPIDGFQLAACPALHGDDIERTVSWNGNSDVSPLAGKPIRLRVELIDADLYSLRFLPDR